MSMFKAAVCQIDVQASKTANLDKAAKMLYEAKEKGADIVVLPEMFNCPYDISFFKKYAESINNSETVNFLSEIAAKNEIYIIGGTIPEYEEGKLFNTCLVFDKNGKIISKYRKVHLFEVELKGKVCFSESRIFSSGNTISLFETEYGKFGVCICFDIRYPEYFMRLSLEGAEVIFVPAAFSKHTGKVHWETLIRTRAIDNQLYVVGAAPAKYCGTSFEVYGHSMVADPWGNVVACADYDELLVMCDIDLDYVHKVRKELPILKNRRPELY